MPNGASSQGSLSGSFRRITPLSVALLQHLQAFHEPGNTQQGAVPFPGIEALQGYALQAGSKYAAATDRLAQQIVCVSLHGIGKRLSKNIRQHVEHLVHALNLLIVPHESRTENRICGCKRGLQAPLRQAGILV
jgi:hypothetical protein